MADHPRLRLVRDDGAPPVTDGSVDAVLEDLEVAAGYLEEAQAELAECDVDPTVQLSAQAKLGSARLKVAETQKLLSP